MGSNDELLDQLPFLKGNADFILPMMNNTDLDPSAYPLGYIPFSLGDSSTTVMPEPTMDCEPTLSRLGGYQRTTINSPSVSEAKTTRIRWKSANVSPREQNGPFRTTITVDQQSQTKPKAINPIFVTESPQSTYKKRSKTRSTTKSKEAQEFSSASDSPSPPSAPLYLSNDYKPEDYVDQADLQEQLRHLSSKERRQLQNRISARNFRIRHKEYIRHLEVKVSQQEKEIKMLQNTNSHLEKANQELTQELQLWRDLACAQMNTPLATVSAQNSLGTASESDSAQASETEYTMESLASSDSTSSDNDMPMVTATVQTPQELYPDEMQLFDFNPLFSPDIFTNIAQTVIPNFNFKSIQNETLLPTQPEHSQFVLDPAQFIKTYPLFVPALMSMILQHISNLEYAKYLTSTLFPPKGLSDIVLPDYYPLGILLHEKYAYTLAYDSDNAQPKLSPNGKDDHADSGKDTHRNLKSIEHHPFEKTDSVDTSKAALMRRSYFMYTFYRLCGYSHEQIVEKERESHGCFVKHTKQLNKVKCTIKSAMRTVTEISCSSSSMCNHSKRSQLVSHILKVNKTFPNPQEYPHFAKHSNHKTWTMSRTPRASRVPGH